MEENHIQFFGFWIYFKFESILCSFFLNIPISRNKFEVLQVLLPWDME